MLCQLFVLNPHIMVVKALVLVSTQKQGCLANV